MSTADRLRALADELLAAAEGGPFSVVNTEMWIADLNALATDIEKIAAVPELAKTNRCGKQARFARGALCDRPDRHNGGCSWEAERAQRHAREFEAAAIQVPGLKRQTGDLQRRLAQAEKRVEEQRLKEEAQQNRRSRRKVDRG